MVNKILVVDDEPDLELLISQRFRKKIADKEYQFIFAKNGVEALEILKEQTDVEIILTDINMPEMDGLTLLAHLQQLDRPYKAVVISAYEDMSNIRTAMNNGAVDFLTKPIDFNDLEVTVAKIITELQRLKDSIAVKKRLSDLDKELEVARLIQQEMLPKKIELLQGNSCHYEMRGVVLPARQIGGDFFDFFALNDRRLGLIIADVSGKSISASLFMAVTKTLFRAIARQYSSAAEALGQVNKVLSAENTSCMFVTAFYAIFDPKAGILSYSNAGHTCPYIVSADGNVMQIGKEGSSLPLGLDNTILPKGVFSFEEHSIALKDRDCLVLYTDGITEAMNRRNQLYKQQRLEEVLAECGDKSLTELIDRIVADIREFSSERDQSDDIALLCLKYYLQSLATGKSQTPVVVECAIR